MRILAGIDLNIPGHEWIVDRAGMIAAMVGGRVDLLFIADSEAWVQPSLNLLEVLLNRVPVAHRGMAHCVAGAPVEILVERSADYELLVVGPREPGLLERWVMGPIAARVLKGSQSALYVPRRAEPPPARPRLLLGLDIAGPRPQDVLSMAALYAKPMNAVIDVLYVAPPGSLDANDRAASVVARIEDLMRATIDAAQIGQAVVHQGDPAIAMVGASIRYDIVLIGSRPRPGIANFLLGSVPENVLRQSACDVLALPSRD
jgi:nucleotide-binding universal stress UspA family protein